MRTAAAARLPRSHAKPENGNHYLEVVHRGCCADASRLVYQVQGSLADDLIALLAAAPEP